MFLNRLSTLRRVSRGYPDPAAGSRRAGVGRRPRVDTRGRAARGEGRNGRGRRARAGRRVRRRRASFERGRGRRRRRRDGVAAGGARLVTRRRRDGRGARAAPRGPGRGAAGRRAARRARAARAPPARTRDRSPKTRRAGSRPASSSVRHSTSARRRPWRAGDALRRRRARAPRRPAAASRDPDGRRAGVRVLRTRGPKLRDVRRGAAGLGAAVVSRSAGGARFRARAAPPRGLDGFDEVRERRRAVALLVVQLLRRARRSGRGTKLPFRCKFLCAAAESGRAPETIAATILAKLSRFAPGQRSVTRAGSTRAPPFPLDTRATATWTWPSSI